MATGSPVRGRRLGRLLLAVLVTLVGLAALDVAFRPTARSQGTAPTREGMRLRLNATETVTLTLRPTGPEQRWQVWVQKAAGPPQRVWTAPPLTHVGWPVRDGDRLLFPLVPTGTANRDHAATLVLPLGCLSRPTTCKPQVIPAAEPSALPPLPRLTRPVQRPLTPPAFIRVRHDPRNPCRQVPPGQVDTIPFEEYVARVLPAEMPASWPQAALQAQAIAIRTYAWYHILLGKPDYDVSDWTDYQVMCDARYPATDAAVTATRGQALFYAGVPILAMYSAQNGHPTRGIPWLPYLTPVPDPVSLGQPRRGHGLGLSQWGAKAWAERGWNAYQILAHYYPGTSLYLPPDAPAPVGTVLPPELEGMTLGRAYPLRILVGSPRPLAALTLTVSTAEGDTWTILTRTAPITTWVGVWAPPATFSSPHPITLAGEVRTVDGRQVALAPTYLWRDLRPLSVTLTTTERTLRPQWPFTVTQRTPPDVPLLLGVGDGWVWTAKEGTVLPVATGAWVTDTAALGGTVWEHPAGSPPATWHSPPVTALEPGRSYRAWFRLAVEDATSPEVVVYLDVVGPEGQPLLGMRAVRGIEFPAARVYREFPVDFHLFGDPADPPPRVVFRVHAYGRATLRLDRVLVTEYPRPSALASPWRLPQRPGTHTLTVKAVTPTGIPSADIPVTTALEMPVPPLTITLVPPKGWLTEALSLTWRITSAVAPPDTATFAYRRRDSEGWTSWHPLTVTLLTSRTAQAYLPAAALPDGRVVLQVQGQDAFTYWGRSAPVTVPVDTQPPIIQAQASALPNGRGWYTTPITVSLRITDHGSGLDTLHVCPSLQPCVTLTSPPTRLQIPFVEEGVHGLTVTARDRVSHTTTLSQTYRLDLFPPQVDVLVPPRETVPLLVRRPALKVRWLGRDTHAIVGYDVAVWRPGEGWRPWYTATVRTQGMYVGQAGETVAFRARAHDVAGWIGPWSRPVTVTFPFWTFVPYIAP